MAPRCRETDMDLVRFLKDDAVDPAAPLFVRGHTDDDFVSGPRSSSECFVQQRR